MIAGFGTDCSNLRPLLALTLSSWQVWIKQLRDDGAFAKTDEKGLQVMMCANAWIYENLIDARTCAAEYLNDVCEEFENARDHVAKAARLYGELAQRLRAGWKDAPFPHQHSKKPWTSQMRHAQADVLEECLALEKQAITEIEQALATMDRDGKES